MEKTTKKRSYSKNKKDQKKIDTEFNLSKKGHDKKFREIDGLKEFHLNNIKLYKKPFIEIKKLKTDELVKIEKKRSEQISNNFTNFQKFKNLTPSLLNAKARSISLQKENKEIKNKIIKEFFNYTKQGLRTINYIKQNEKYLIIKKPKKVRLLNKNKKKLLAVFDLDETLMHSDILDRKEDISQRKNCFEIKFSNGSIEKIEVNIRPFLKEAMALIYENYEIAVYTSSEKEYADVVLDYIDPKNKYFYNRFYREDCLEVQLYGKTYHFKDLFIFEDFDINKILIIDNSVQSFGFNLDNGIPILFYIDLKNDNDLLSCAKYLSILSKFENLSLYNKKFIKMSKYLEEIKDNDKFDFSFEQ